MTNSTTKLTNFENHVLKAKLQDENDHAIAEAEEDDDSTPVDDTVTEQPIRR